MGGGGRLIAGVDCDRCAGEPGLGCGGILSVCGQFLESCGGFGPANPTKGMSGCRSNLRIGGPSEGDQRADGLTVVAISDRMDGTHQGWTVERGQGIT